MKCPFCIKVCKICNKILVAYNGNFNKKKSGKYGIESKCKECCKIFNKTYYEANSEKIKSHNKKYKENNKEYYDKYNKEYYDKNKQDILEDKKQYYKENKEEINKQKKQYLIENKEEINKKRRKKYRENRKEILKRRKEYVKENPDKVFNSSSKRRQLEKQQGSGVSKEQWQEMMKFFDWKCAYSGEVLTNKNRTIDHIIPLSKYGLNEVWNCIPCFNSYNYSKRDKDMLNWYKQQEFYSEERLQKIYEWIEYAKNKWDIN